MTADTPSLSDRNWLFAKISFTLLSVALALYLASDVVLLIFAGMLLAIFLNGIADWLKAHTPLSRQACVGVVVLLLVGLFAFGGWWVAPRVSDEFAQLNKRVPESFAEIRDSLRQYSWGRTFLDEIGQQADSARSAGTTRSILTRMTGVVSSLLGWLTNILIIVFIGLYGANEPGLYRRGFMHLIPKPHRKRADEVLTGVSDTLFWWVIGKLISMTVVGVLTTLGLWLLDVPLAFLLGVISAAFTFIPNVGPILSAIPAVLIGFSVSPRLALYIVGLNLAVQVLESYFITPFVQRRTVSLPPVVIISAQILMGVLFGAIGLALATPLTAAAFVLVQMIYVKDILHDDLKTAPA